VGSGSVTLTAGTLNISPGNTVTLNGGVVEARSGATLNALGTAAKPITFTSIHDFTGTPTPAAPGDWSGLDFRDGSSGGLTYVTVKYAGSGSSYADGYGYAAAAIVVGNTTQQIDATNVTVKDSQGNGVFINNGANPILTNLTATYCTTCYMSGGNPLLNTGTPIAYYFVPGDLTNAIGGESASGYSDNVVDIVTGTSFPVVTGAWPSSGLPFRLDTSVTIPAGGTLTISPGVTVRMAGTGFAVASGGTLNLAGTALGPDTLTSSHDFLGSATAPANGDWRSVYYEAGSAGGISYTTLKYAGATTNGSICGSCNTAVLVEGVNPSIVDSTFAHSLGNDIEVDDGGLPTLARDVFGAVPSGNYGVTNDGWTTGQPNVEATPNFWGDPTGPYNSVSNAGGLGTPVSSGVTFNPWYATTNVTANSVSGGTATASVLGAFGAAGSIGSQAGGGTGGLAVDTFNTNPTGSTLQGNPAVFFDVRIAYDPFGTVTVTDCDLTGNQMLFWFNGTTWAPASNQTQARDAHGCESATITSTTTPSLSNLTTAGVVFAGGLESVTNVLKSSSTNNTSTYGGNVTLTATLTSAYKTPLGSVKFMDGNTQLAVTSLNASGVATFSTTAFTAGSHSLSDVYTPATGSGYLAGTPGALTQTVKPAPLTITADSYSVAYGQAVPSVGFTSSGWVNGEGTSSLTTQPSCSTTAAQGSDAGVYATACSGAADSNYTITYVNGTVTITPIGSGTALTSSSTNNTSTYGQSVTLTAKVTGSYGTPTGTVAFMNGSSTLKTISLSSGQAAYTTTGLPAGTDTLIAKYTPATNSKGGTNYTGSTSSTVTQTVNPAAITATAGSPTVTYGQSDVTVSYSTSSSPLCQSGPPNPYCKPRAFNPIVSCGYTGLQNGDTAPSIAATGLTSARPGAPAGAYSTRCWGAYDPNYTVSYVGGTLTVNQAPLTVHPNHTSVAHGSPLPQLTWRANFVNHDAASSLSRQPSCRASVKTNRRGLVVSPAGKYRIRCAGAKDPNYRIHYTSGVLRVIRARAGRAHERRMLDTRRAGLRLSAS
jgi:MBG domain (YGX type)/Bacterial Ig-like domain (group 3)